jgi:uncharacterized membrane protein
MHTTIKISRFFFAAGMIGLAAQQFIFGDFRPVMVPPYEAWTAGKAICAYIFSAGLVIASLAIMAEKQARAISLLFGGIMLLLFVFLLLPYQFAIGQTSVGAFTNPLKGLAISGCFFVVADSFPPGRGGRLTSLLEKLIPAGPVFYSITMIVFGVAHFLYPGFVATLVPNWIPGHIFWTYVAGVALIASGVGIALRIQGRLAANLLGIAIFVWFLVLHIPRGIADPHSGEGNEWASVFEALAFSGTCFIMGANLPKSWQAAPAKKDLYQVPEYTG